MAAPRSIRGVTRGLVALGLLVGSGCDRLPGGDDGANKADAEADATPKAEEQTKSLVEVQREEEAAKAKQAAEAEAAKAKQAAEAKAQADAEAAAAAKKAADEQSRRPVKLDEIAVKTMGSMFSSSGMIEVRAKATLNQALGTSTYVHIKSLCKREDELLADVGYLNAHYTKPLEQYAVGEQAEIKGNLYTQGSKVTPKLCQFEFRVGGMGGGLSVPVGHACWKDGSVTPGQCDPVLVPIAMSGAKHPIEVSSLDVTPGGSIGGSKNLTLDYLLKIQEPMANNVRLTFKTACRVGDRSFADLGQANLSAGPFKYESGETVARTASLYWSSAFEFADAPDDCDVTTSLWRTKTGTFGEYEEVRLQDACFKAGTLTETRCDPTAAPPPAAAPLAAESIVVDEVQLALAEPYGATGKFQLKIQADITLELPVTQNDGVTAKVSCKAGKDTRVESAYLFGTELYYLLPGETTRMTASAFGSHALEVEPKSCRVEFFGGPRFSPSGSDGVELGSFCLKKGKVKKGGRC
ncbi:MAG: hypothetical protein AAF799_33800 [Myxococcota bacterium]